MVTRIPNEAGPSQASFNFPGLASRRSLNPACRDVQATLSSFRFSATTVESPVSGATAATDLVDMDEDDEYVEPSCMLDASSRRPSVQRTSSAPEPSSAQATLFVEPAGPSVLRPSLARACSESRACGVLERRRGRKASSRTKLPSNLMLDLADLPMTIGAGNLDLLRAARKALAEPAGFDWGRVAMSAPASSSSSRFTTQQQPKRAAKFTTTASLPVSATASTSASPESCYNAGGLVSSRSYGGVYGRNRTPATEESEWDWALAGNARATHEALRYSSYKETREPVHDIWMQLPDWMSRRSSHGGRDADLSLRGPGLFNPFGLGKAVKDQAGATAAAAAATAVTSAALSLSLSQASISNLSPRNSLSGRGRAAKVSVHVPYRVIEEMPPRDGSLSPRASISGPPVPPSDRRRSLSTERVQPAIA